MGCTSLPLGVPLFYEFAQVFDIIEFRVLYRDVWLYATINVIIVLVSQSSTERRDAIIESVGRHHMLDGATAASCMHFQLAKLLHILQLSKKFTLNMVITRRR